MPGEAAGQAASQKPAGRAASVQEIAAIACIASGGAT
jgi:hypothetical protein